MKNDAVPFLKYIHYMKGIQSSLELKNSSLYENRVRRVTVGHCDADDPLVQAYPSDS